MSNMTLSQVKEWLGTAKESVTALRFHVQQVSATPGSEGSGLRDVVTAINGEIDRLEVMLDDYAAALPAQLALRHQTEA